MYHLHFVLQGVEKTVCGGTLAQACADAGYPLDLVCGGRGACGKCRVQVRAAGLPDWVPACETPVDRDMSVWLTEADLTRKAVIATEGISAQAHRLSPSVSRRSFTRQALTSAHCGAWLKEAPLEVLERFSHLAADRSVGELTFTYYGGELIDVCAGDRAGKLYGGAVDIGTTSVVLYVYDLISGVLLDTQAELNGQISHGADVVSRIQYATDAPGGTAELCASIRATIERLLERAEQRIPGLRKDLYHMVLCGNSTMQQLFLELNPAGLACAPFVNVTAAPVRTEGRRVDLSMAPGGQVDFLPLLGGFVGADTASVLLTLPEDGKRRLVIDLGTNGEIGVGESGGYRVASTACGPALEGGNIACGMRGAEGAVERVDIRGDQVSVQVIGGGAPAGLCGSAIIDSVAGLLRAGLLDETGRLLPPEEFSRAHPGSALTERLFQLGAYQWAFRIVGGVYLSQADVRQVQLAKSAICAGCAALLDEAGLTLDDVEEVCLAGAFGCYIDIGHALEIGLLPPAPREKIASIGNGAGRGVQLCLLDRAQLERCRSLPSRVEHLELATSSKFMEDYLQNINF